jgi:hypothetical protein
MQLTSSPATGGFLVTYPDHTVFGGNATCLYVSGKTAYLTGLINHGSGPRVASENWTAGNYVVIGILDNGVATPADVNVSPGFASSPGCGPNGAATPVFPIVKGNFQVETLKTWWPYS